MKNSIFLSLAFLVCIASLAFCGCNRENPEDITPSIVNDIDYDTDVFFSGSVFIAPGISQYFAEPLQRRAIKTASSIQDANVVICPTAFISANADLLAEYMEHNGIIIEMEPESAGHNAWFGAHGFGRIDDFMSISAFGVYKSNTYILDDIFQGSISSGDPAGAHRSLIVDALNLRKTS